MVTHDIISGADFKITAGSLPDNIARKEDMDVPHCI